VPTQFNTAEFRRAEGPDQHNAHVAWAAGHTGAGVTIAVVDTGIDVDSPEFAGRLSPQSTDLYASRNQLNSTDDHGTNVAMVAAAARDGLGTVGIAWQAQLLAIRADEPGSCKSDDPASTSDCSFLDDDIGRGVSYALANGARVINISLGGEGGASAALERAVASATAAGVLVLISSGNDGFPALEDFAKELIAVGNGAVLVVGSVGEDYTLSDFSNRPGADSQFYIAARGERVCCEYRDGQLYIDGEGFRYLLSGTSFATPQVAGAAALLAQAFPNLTGRQIADILLRSAFDAGDSGADAVFGRGILDISKAFQPIGTTTVAGTGGALTLGLASGTLSPAMGDALASGSLTTLVLDEYARAFTAEIGGSFQTAALRSPLHGALAGQQRQLAAGNAGAAVAFTVDASGQAQALRLTSDQSQQARVLAARVALQLSPDTQLGFAYAQGADGLVAQLQGQDRPAFMIAGSSLGDSGLWQDSDAALAVRHRLGQWGLTVSAQSGQSDTAVRPDRRTAQLGGVQNSADLASMGLSADRRFGAIDAALGLTWLGEQGSLLGAQFQPGLGLDGADSLFIDLSAGWDLGADWRLGGSLRQGQTRARGRALVARGSRLTSRGFTIDLQRRNMLARGDALALRVSQPLRVESGALGLSLPSSWDYATLAAQSTLHWLALKPSGRELDAELAWRGPLWGGHAASSLFWRRDPGHVAALPADKGVALRWSRGF
jgi:hypothetical protein